LDLRCYGFVRVAVGCYMPLLHGWIAVVFTVWLVPGYGCTRLPHARCYVVIAFTFQLVVTWLPLPLVVAGFVA